MKPIRTVLLPALFLATAACHRGGGGPDASGTVEVTEVRLAPEVAGRIVELPLTEGQVLKAGDLVARLDPAGFLLRRDEARASRALAQAQLDLLRAGSRAEDIRRAEAQVREAQAAAWQAEQTRTRIQSVFAQGSATAQQADEARAAADRAAAAAKAAEEQLARLRQGSRAEEIQAAEAALAQADARLAQAEKALADTAVTAPRGGTVLVRSAEAGEVVAAGTTLAVLGDLQDAWLTIYVPEPRLHAVKLGAPARIRVDGDAGWRTGTVSFVSAEAEFTPRNVQTAEERAKLVYRAKVTLPNPEGALKPGQPADVWLDAP